MLTVLTWLWQQPNGRTEYDATAVNVWAAMVRRHLTIPHRIACVTATPAGIDPRVAIIAPPGDFEDVATARWSQRKPQCYRRLAMFRRDAASIFGERFVCMDLDCVIGGPLDPLFVRPDDLVLFKGTAPSRPYNGSMMLVRAGCRPHVYEDFTPEGATAAGEKYCGSDQAWLAASLGWGEQTWSHRDGVYWFGSRFAREIRKGAPRVLFFPGTIKPWNARHIDLFTRKHYRAEMREAA